MNTDLNIKMLLDNNLGTGFIKKHMKSQSLMSSEKMTRGDKVQECHTESNTILSLESLGPFNYSKLNEARLNLQVQKDFKDLGIEVL